MAPQGELHRQGDHGEDGQEESFGGELRALGHNLPVPGPGPGLAGERLYEVLMHLDILEGARVVGDGRSDGEQLLGGHRGTVTGGAGEELAREHAWLQLHHRPPAGGAQQGDAAGLGEVGLGEAAEDVDV